MVQNWIPNPEKYCFYICTYKLRFSFLFCLPDFATAYLSYQCSQMGQCTPVQRPLIHLNLVAKRATCLYVILNKKQLTRKINISKVLLISFRFRRQLTTITSCCHGVVYGVWNIDVTVTFEHPHHIVFKRRETSRSHVETVQ